MKLKKAKIIISSWEATKRDLKRALATGIPDIQAENEIYFGNWFSFASSLTPQRLAILATISMQKPKSIYELAKMMKSDFKNVHSNVKYLADLGLIDLKKTGQRSAIMPIAKYRGIDIEFAA